MIIETSAESFENDVLKSDGVVLVDYYATWCGPCKMLGAILKTLDEKNLGVKICKIDLDQNPSLADNYGITSLPTIHIFRNGEMIKEFIGLQPLNSLLTACTV